MCRLLNEIYRYSSIFKHTFVNAVVFDIHMESLFSVFPYAAQLSVSIMWTNFLYRFHWKSWMYGKSIGIKPASCVYLYCILIAIEDDCVALHVVV